MSYIYIPLPDSKHGESPKERRVFEAINIQVHTGAQFQGSDMVLSSLESKMGDLSVGFNIMFFGTVRF